MKDRIKVGYIGLGRRGTNVLQKCISEMNDVDIAMICDLNDFEFEKINNILREKGKAEAVATTNYHDILNNSEIDAVFIMTGWESRVDIVKDAMRAGKYTGFEVGCAFDIQECHDLLNIYEETKTPIMMLE